MHQSRLLQASRSLSGVSDGADFYFGNLVARSVICDVLSIAANGSSQQAVVNHLTVIVVNEESPESDGVATKDLSDLEVVDVPVPEEHHEELVLNGFTDWHFFD